MAPMTESVALVTSVISAGAAAIGTFVTVSQWRASRPSRAAPVGAAAKSRKSSQPQASSGTTAKIPPEAVPQVHDRLKRWAGRVAILGILACVTFSLTALFIGVGHMNNKAVFYPIILVSAVSAILDIIIGLPVLATALTKLRLFEARITTIGLLLALMPWVLLYIFRPR